MGARVGMARQVGLLRMCVPPITSGAKVALYDREIPADAEDQAAASRSPAFFPAVRRFSEDPFRMASTLQLRDEPQRRRLGSAGSSGSAGVADNPSSSGESGEAAPGPDAAGRPIVVATCVDLDIDRLDFSLSHRQFRMLHTFATAPAPPPEPATPTEASKGTGRQPATKPAVVVSTGAKPVPTAEAKAGEGKDGWLSWAWNVVVGEEGDDDEDGPSKRE